MSEQHSGGFYFDMHTAAQCTMIQFETASAGLESKAIIFARNAELVMFWNYYTDYITIIAIHSIIHIIPKFEIAIQA
jgi:hypothetical protein